MPRSQRFLSQACEAAGAIRTVASLTREADCCRLYSNELEVPQKRSNKTAVWGNGVYAFTQSLNYWVIGLIFWYGSTQIIAGLSIQNFFVALIAVRPFSFFFFFSFFRSHTLSCTDHFRRHQRCFHLLLRRGQYVLASAYVKFDKANSARLAVSKAKQASSAAVKLYDSRPLIDAESTIGEPFALEKAQGHIRFENVHFRYPSRKHVPVLKGLDFEVRPGQFCAIVGGSGCGYVFSHQLLEAN
jgi:ATP-binding cassette subfamily B (MDR/TAP) protein 1